MIIIATIAGGRGRAGAGAGLRTRRCAALSLSKIARRCIEGDVTMWTLTTTQALIWLSLVVGMVAAALLV